MFIIKAINETAAHRIATERKERNGNNQIGFRPNKEEHF